MKSAYSHDGKGGRTSHRRLRNRTGLVRCERQAGRDSGTPSTSDIASTAAEAAAAQLTNFGITVDLLKSSNFYSNATAENCPYDLMLEWTDLNMSFSYPTGSYNQFSSVYSQWIHVDRYPTDYEDAQKAGNVKLVFDGLDGDEKTYEFERI
ncbi:MAG: hypothetical protein ACLRSW_03585 [Christensenellaceae bacterium]